MQPDPSGTNLSLIGTRYAGFAGGDVMLGPDGSIREEWQQLLRKLERIGDLEARRQEGHRLLRENGVSFNAGLGQGTQHWTLDPVPYVISGQEWREVAGGLEQRARLFDALLRDLYGPRETLSHGLIPAELVYTHPGYLRACDGTFDVPSPGLFGYAADVALGPDGRMRVVVDRTDRPAGFGYALETRIVSARILPKLISDSRVRRLAPFFGSMRDTLVSWAPTQKVNPRIVVLSQGPDAEEYFDHAYLASYLGYSLVQGDDLTVRQGRVYLRTVEGLKLVDVVMRRLEGQFCDPLELEPSSGRGVPGLLEAARRGHVHLANPLGSSVLENPALQCYLSGACQYLLGEDLKLPSVQTWWCGDAQALAMVEQRLPELLVKEVDRRGMIVADQLTPNERDALIDTIRANPNRYVAQENSCNITVPSLENGVVNPRYIVTRCFVTRSGDGFSVMPGGLSRIFGERSSVSSLRDVPEATIKDTWVLADADEEQPARLSAAVNVRFRDTAESVPSRAAEKLFWVGRYAEGAESVVRLARSLMQRTRESREYIDRAETESTERLKALLHDLLADLDAETGTDTLLAQIMSEEQTQGSIGFHIAGLMRSANDVRERWSSDCWRILDDLTEDLEPHHQHQLGRDILPALETTCDRLIAGLQAFSGFTSESMTRGHGWRFLVIGRRVERALWTIRCVRAALASENAAESLPAPFLESLLLVFEALLTHRRQHLSYVSVDTVLELLLLGPTNPRSLMFQIESLRTHVDALPAATRDEALSGAQRCMLEASTLIQLSEQEALAAWSERGRLELAYLLDRVETLVERTVEALTLAYFAHVSTPRQLAMAEPLLAPDGPGSDQMQGGLTSGR